MHKLLHIYVLLHPKPVSNTEAGFFVRSPDAG
jgi:hypothetical protein